MNGHEDRENAEDERSQIRLLFHVDIWRKGAVIPRKETPSQDGDNQTGRQGQKGMQNKAHGLYSR